MATQGLELSNSSYWQDVYHLSRSATYLPGSSTRHERIPPIEVPQLFDSHVLAVYPDSATAKDWWILGGWVSRRIPTGILIGGTPDTRATESQKLILREVNLLIYPNITSTFSLVIDAPYWFDNFSIIVWQYTGPVSYSDEGLIIEQNTQLDRIEQKIDTL